MEREYLTFGNLVEFQSEDRFGVLNIRGILHIPAGWGEVIPLILEQDRDEP